MSVSPPKSLSRFGHLTWKAELWRNVYDFLAWTAISEGSALHVGGYRGVQLRYPTSLRERLAG